MAMNDSLVLGCDAENAAQAVTAALERRGLRAMRGFDLHLARVAESGCECQHHGTARCTCEYLVLLVYGQVPSPLTLVFHGQGEGRVGVQVGQSFGIAPDPDLQQQVMGVLLEAALSVMASADRDVAAGAE